MRCVYDADSPARRQKSISTLAAASSPDAPFQPVPTSPSARHAIPVASQRTSVEPEVRIDNGVAIGPSSGVSFLYTWHEAVETRQEAYDSTTLASYGDVPLPRVPKADLPTLEEGYLLVNHYFTFAMPTFRFFHQQTLERWMVGLVEKKPLPAAQAASVLIIWAQSLGFAAADPVDDTVMPQRSLSYYEQARILLAGEVGPTSLASVEARLAACLYLLSISHINECRFLFSFTHALALSLGLHRRSPRGQTATPLTSERRKRAFWSLYSIDGYLSVMLGIPRYLRDDDLDQDYPSNVDDLALDNAADLALVPHHGNLEAFVYHCRLARLFAQSNDLLYPLQQLSKDEIVQRGMRMVSALDKLEQELPTFLKPRLSSSLGSQIWDRQNSVLGLGLAHARIIATRRTLLISPSEGADQLIHYRHETCMKICLDAIGSVLHRVHSMVQHDRMLRGFWMTQYIALCAISTLFVYKIQRDRQRVSLPADIVDLSELLLKADEVQEHLAKIASPGSQAQRHQDLLSKLKQKAHLSFRPAGASNVVSSFEGSVPVYDSQAGSKAVHEHAQLGFSEVMSNDDFTPVNIFNDTIPDAESWQYLDQLVLQPEFDTIWPLT